jgi:GT2 family glycosyltransferase
VTVVVSTLDRPARLARLLDALRGQTLPPEEFEVIVVDDGSGPATAAVLREAAAAGDLALSAIRHPSRRGQAAGRNTGWRAASGPLVAFTDDDCVPEPGWLGELLAAADRDPGAIVQGVTVPDSAELPSDRTRIRTVRSTTLGPQYETCNIAYPRTLLEQLGGFDERWAVAEDTDLAWRAFEHGHRAVLAPDAIVRHAVEQPGTCALLRGAARWGRSAHVFAAHPGARTMLHRRLFWNPWHYLLVRSVVALAAPRWARRLVHVRHLLALVRRARALGGPPTAVPFLIVYDLIETAAMVRGAIRHRTPLL